MGLIIILSLISLNQINSAFTQLLDCSIARDDLIDVCEKMIDLFNNASNAKNDDPIFLGLLPDEAPERPGLLCIDLKCVCPFYGGKTNGSINDCTLPNGQKLQKAVRKEIRMLTDQERYAFFKALRDMKDNVDYDYIASLNKLAYQTGGAHGGPAFFGFYRQYINTFEIMLRKYNTSLALPYWDSTLDAQLSVPADSILFTEQFFGITNDQGYVVTGPFANWTTLEGNPSITRNISQDGGLIEESDVQWTLSQTKIENILGYTFPSKTCPIKLKWNWFEFIYGKPLNFIGGDMDIAYPNKASNDPILFFLHSFVDLIFETWRQSKQTRSQRIKYYPDDLLVCESPLHFKNAKMTQFAPLKNIDGLRNEYTDNMYEYAPRPTCTDKTECGSKYLFCDSSHGDPHCASKIRPGGNCTGFINGEDVCLNSTCLEGVCVAASSTTVTTSQATTETSTLAQTKAVTSKTIYASETSSPKTTSTTQLPENIKTTNKSTFVRIIRKKASKSKKKIFKASTPASTASTLLASTSTIKPTEKTTISIVKPIKPSINEAETLFINETETKSEINLSSFDESFISNKKSIIKKTIKEEGLRSTEATTIKPEATTIKPVNTKTIAIKTSKAKRKIY